MIPDARELMPDLEREAIFREAQPFDPLTRLEDFSKRFPTAVQILRIGGVHPTEVIEMNNPYTGQPDQELFTNVGEHCLAVACVADVFADLLYKNGAITEDEANEASEKALKHDTNKRIEVFRKKAARAGSLPSDDIYSPRGYATIAPILRAQGYDQTTISYIERAGQETGHGSLIDFLTLQNGIPALVPDRMVDKIVHLADDMTSTAIPAEGERPLTVYLTPWERMVASEFPTRYQFMWKEGLGFAPSGEVITISDITTAEKVIRWIRSYAYWQPFVSNEICREIQSITDPKSTQRPESFVKDLVNRVLVSTH